MKADPVQMPHWVVEQDQEDQHDPADSDNKIDCSIANCESRREFGNSAKYGLN